MSEHERSAFLKCHLNLIICSFFTGCPPSKNIKYACRGYTRQVKYVYYVFRNNECKRRIIRRRERCRCPKRKYWTFCRHTTGARVTCLVTYRLSNRGRPHCIRLKRCRSRRPNCPKAVIKRGHCNRKTGTRIVCKICYIRNKYRCRCEKRVKKWTEICGEYLFPCFSFQTTTLYCIE